MGLYSDYIVINTNNSGYIWLNDEIITLYIYIYVVGGAITNDTMI